MYKKFLSKDNGITIFEHSESVKDFALAISKRFLIDDKDINECIKISALLHDIGKITEKFQKFLKGKKTELKSKFRHNEIGWAVLSKYLNVNKDVFSHIIDAVYWHHGISNELSKYSNNDILEHINQKDIDNMIDYVKNVLGEKYIIKNDRKLISPKYYFDEIDGYENHNQINSIIRTCLLSADRIVSSLSKEELCNIENIEEYINNYTERYNSLSITKNPYINTTRFDIQKEISENNDKTIIVKAPAGFGKTLIGLLWAMKTNKKIIWVCPRNEIAYSVYYSILDEFKTFGIDGKIELYLTGEVVESNSNSIGFDSDIIITNIDNYLSPTINNNHIDKLFLINDCEVIFDEYHELVSDEALFSCFINIMKIRHNYTNSKTLLLSATPINMNYLWDSLGNNTTILPNKDQHYNAAHNKQYEIKVCKNFENVNIINKNNNLLILNSIKNSQQYYHDFNFNILYHSYFESSDRKNIMTKIYSQYNKKSNRILGKDDVVSTHILQASLDISFLNLYESVLSPESTMQRIGRIDRWGDYIQKSTINIIKIDNQSENTVKDIFYTKELSNLWYDYMLIFNNTKLTLNDLYNEYNKFSHIYEDKIVNFIKKKYDNSLKKLTKIYPIKFNKVITKTDIMSAGSNKLRNSGNDIFFIVKKHKSNEYSDLFNIAIRKSIGEDFKEEGNILNKIQKCIKEIVNNNDKRYDYSEINKRNSLDYIRKIAKKSNTPYIRFDKIYHSEYGLIDINDPKI